MSRRGNRATASVLNRQIGSVLTFIRAMKPPASCRSIPMANAKCESCKFFDEHKVNGAAAQHDEGLCRFNPPVSQPGPEAHGLWPVVGSTDWCGHYTPEMTAAE